MTAEAERAIRRLKTCLRFVEDGARLTIEKMVSDFGVNRRTVNRDLEDLRNLFGLDLEAEPCGCSPASPPRSSLRSIPNGRASSASAATTTPKPGHPWKTAACA